MKAFRNALLILCSLLLPQALLAHGSVTAEGDLCIIRIGFYTAHFKVFQPQTSRDREYCEDLPATGESVFVMDYLHQGLAAVPIEFRIIRDVTGLGRFTRLDDVLALGDLEPLTVFYQPPVLEADVFTVLHDFPEAGDFLGVVSVRHPETGELYQAVFPFSVGFRGWGMLPLFVLLAVLAQVGYWIATGGYARWRATRKRVAGNDKQRAQMLMLLPLLLLPLQLMAATAPEPQRWSSADGQLLASYRSEVTPVPLNQIHAWILHLENSSGAPLENALVTVAGGMPAHNHGLATAPVVTAYLGEGDYRVEGLRFHMQGAWELRVSVSHANTSATIVIPLSL